MKWLNEVYSDVKVKVVDDLFRVFCLALKVYNLIAQSLFW